MQKGIDYIGTCVVFLCHDGKGNFLMNKRGHSARDEKGCWDIGGGGLEFGIPIAETLRNEIKEEYGADVLDYEFLGYRDVHREHEGKKTHWIALDFKVLIDPKQAKNGEPHKFDEIGWFTYKTLPTPVHSQLKTFFTLHAKKI